MFSTIKLIIVLVIFAAVAAAGWYITGLRADLATSQENTKKMVEAVETQKQAIEQLKVDQQKIKDINNELNTTIKLQNKDVESLRNKFTQSASGEKRDFGKAAVAKPQSLEKAINRGTVNAFRCIEIASGSPLTQQEKNATNPSEINRECPSLANPNYKPAASN